MPPRTLKDLPIHLRRFAAHKAYNVPEEDNECMVCMRTFNTKDDIFNLSETPCRPYRLQPCNHLIGSECLKEMLRRGSTSCPYCTIRLGTVNPVPRWIMYLLKSKSPISPAYWLPRAQQHATSQGRAELGSFEALQEQLFKGTLPFSGGVQLYWKYMVPHLLDAVGIVAWCLLTKTLFSIIEFVLSAFPATWHVPRALLSLMGVNVGYVLSVLNAATMMSIVYGADASDSIDMVYVLRSAAILLAMGNVTKLVGLKLVIVFMNGDCVVYGVMVACLIWMGIWRKMF
jgi:hypothetical protein